MTTARGSQPASDERDFVISRAFDAPRSLVFKAWTDPERMAQWWGPRGFTNPVCEMDVRPGGAYRIVMRSPEGVEYPIKGVYREVVAPARLVMTLDCSEHPDEWHDLVNPNRRKGEHNPAGEMLSTVAFEELDGETKLTIRTRFESVAIRDAMLKMGMTEGWTESLERLAEHLADAAGTADREIVTTRVVNAPRERVFETWTDPRHVAQWWGPDGFTNTIQEMDVRPGGVWRFVMRGPDGVDYKNTSVFVEVVKPERLVYSHVSGPTFRMTVTFDKQGGKTKVTMRMLFEAAAEHDKAVKVFGAVEGAKQSLGRLEEHVAKMG